VGADAETVEKAVTIPLEEAITASRNALHQFLEHQQWNERDLNDLYDRLQLDLRPWTCKPRGQRAGAVACGSELDRHLHYQANFNFVFGAGFYTLDSRYSANSSPTTWMCM